MIVSLFGIINTLVLSVFERTRELGMLRAIGMTRRQARRMIRHESIITALIGASIGMPLGIVLAAIVTTRLSSEGLSFAVPWPTLAAFVAVSVLAGIVAAVVQPAGPLGSTCSTRSTTSSVLVAAAGRP